MLFSSRIEMDLFLITFYCTYKLLKMQGEYEVIRPGVGCGVSPKERAEETGLSKGSIDDTETMMKASPLPATPSV